MSKLAISLHEIKTLEEISDNDTIIHSLNPLSKIITTFIYIIVIISFNNYNLSGLIIYTLYPIILMALAEIPYKPLVARLLVALPLAIFAGGSNIFFDKEIAIKLFELPISYGLISFFSIILKTLLTVMSVLILISTTPLKKLFYELHRLKVPDVFITQIMLTYRYISVLLEEVYTMYIAYSLRSQRKNGIQMKDMGAFVGQLLLRSFDRAQRIYIAMKCRGYWGKYSDFEKDCFTKTDLLYTIFVSISFILFRFIDISMLIGNVIGGA